MDELDVICADHLDLIRGFCRGKAYPDPAARAAARDRLAALIVDDPPVATDPAAQAAGRDRLIVDDPPVAASAGPPPRTEQQVYGYIGGLFQDLVDDDALRSRFQEADTTVRVCLRRPAAEITLDLRLGEAMKVEFGPSELAPELVMTMDVGTFHRFLLGKVNFTVALARGQIKAKGPVAKILKLLPLLPLTQARRPSPGGAPRSRRAGGPDQSLESCPPSPPARRAAEAARPVAWTEGLAGRPKD